MKNCYKTAIRTCVQIADGYEPLTRHAVNRRDTRYPIDRSNNAIGHNNRSIVLPVLFNIVHVSKKYPCHHF